MGFMYSRAPNGARNQIGQSNNLGKINLLSKLQILELWIFFSMLATFFWACCFAQNAWIWSYKTINYWFLLELEFWIPSQWQLIVGGGAGRGQLPPHVLGIYLVIFWNFWKFIFCYLLSPPIKNLLPPTLFWGQGQDRSGWVEANFLSWGDSK